MVSFGGIIECVALLLSAASSCWLVNVCSPRSQHLSSRQLWHLGAADLGLSCVQLFGEVPVLIFGLRPAGRVYPETMRSLVHFCLFALCLSETQIVAGITVASLRKQRVAQLMAKALPFTWVVAAACLVAELFLPYIGILHTTMVLPSGEVTGNSLFVGVFMTACFVVAIVLHVIAIVNFVRASSPDVVVRRSYMRAFMYVLTFAGTVLPTWLEYIGVLAVGGVFDSSDHFCGVFRATCLYSNGWVNALTYCLQIPRLSLGPDVYGVVDSQSLSVGFGAVSVSTVSQFPTVVESSASG